MKRRNSKGFTLVELLAVIVILAILMVSAGAGVMSTMNNSKINTYKNEVLTAINSAEDMYSEISMSTQDYGEFVKSNNNTSGGTGVSTYSGLCVTFSGLVNNGYLNKDVTTYGGLILVEVPYDGGATKYVVWAHNTTYGIAGIEKNNINKLKFNKKNNITSGTGAIPTTITSTTDGAYVNSYTGGVGVLTSLNGIKGLLGAAYNMEDPKGEVTKETDCTTDANKVKASCNGQTIKIYSPSENNRGGTGNSYELKCINVKLD